MTSEDEDFMDGKTRVLKARRPADSSPNAPTKSDRQAEIADIARSLGEQIAKALAGHSSPDISVTNEIKAPTEWELTVTARDGDRRIKKMTIRAV